MNYTRFRLSGWSENFLPKFREDYLTRSPESCDLIIKCKRVEFKVSSRIFASNNFWGAARIPHFGFDQLSNIEIDFCEPFEFEWLIYLIFGFKVWIEPDSVDRMQQLCGTLGISYLSSTLA